MVIVPGPVIVVALSFTDPDDFALEVELAQIEEEVGSPAPARHVVEEFIRGGQP